MQGEPTVAISPARQRRLAIVVAGSIVAIAALLAVLIASRTQQYKAMATLDYTEAGDGAPTGWGAAVTTAARVLDDVQLTHMVDQYDLYPKLRQEKMAPQVAAHMRKGIDLTETTQGSLQLTFQGNDPQSAVEITNALAELLAAYSWTASVPAPVSESAPIQQSLHHRQSAPPATADQRTDGSVAMVSRQGLSARDKDALQHQVDRIDDALQDLTATRVGLGEELKEVRQKQETADRSNPSASEAQHLEVPNAERAQLEQQLNVERAKMTSLRQRYTEEYPDVQNEQARIADLEARLSQLPPLQKSAPRVSAKSTTMQESTQEALRARQHQIERDMERTDTAIAGEREHRAQTVEAMQATHTVVSVPTQVAVPKPTPTAAPAKTGAASVAMHAVQITPFRIVDRATKATSVGVSATAEWIWLGIVSMLLLASCFVPLVPARHVAIESAEDVKESVPDHVTYLGGVRRTEL